MKTETEEEVDLVELGYRLSTQTQDGMRRRLNSTHPRDHSSTPDAAPATNNTPLTSAVIPARLVASS